MASSRDRLLVRLRELSLVDLDTLVLGLEGEEYHRALELHIAELTRNLLKAQEEMLALRNQAPSDPLELAARPSHERARDSGEQWSEKSVAALQERAVASRELARLAEACARLVPRLFAADRRAAGA